MCAATRRLPVLARASPFAGAILSGGERNRLLLARLFARPATVLVLDEPTNDLDIETIDLLEELLQDYPGTVFLVSHDRTFWTTWSPAPSPTRATACGASLKAAWKTGYSNPCAARPCAPPLPRPRAPSPPASTRTRGKAARSRHRMDAARYKKKLSYKEQRELEQLPDRIAALETEQQAIQQELADGSLYTRDPQRATALHTREGEIEEELRCWRWSGGRHWRREAEHSS
jgi:ATP-binding cassette subfamily F protein uup